MSKTVVFKLARKMQRNDEVLEAGSVLAVCDLKPGVLASDLTQAIESGKAVIDYQEQEKSAKK